MKQLTLLILAAGEGKRIKPIATSKPLLPFLGMTLLERVMATAKGLQPQQIVIVTNPANKDRVKTLVNNAKVMVQEKPTGMAGAVKAAEKLLHGPTVVVNGDDLIDEKIIKLFRQQIFKTPDQIVLTGINQDLTGGYFDLQGPTLQVVEKPAVKPSEWAKIVLDYFPKIEDFLTGLADDYEMRLNQLPLTFIQTSGIFFQLKFSWNILDIAAGLLTGKNQIDKTAKILGQSEVINSYLGPGVVVGQNCLVRDSVIEAGCVVGFGSEIARSYVGPNNHFHANYIGDSVIEGGSNFGAGAVLANYRFDHNPVGPTGRLKFGAVVGQGAQVGVNASLMPGASLAVGAIARAGEVYR